MSPDGVSRRRFLGSCAAALGASVAGCSLAPRQTPAAERGRATPPPPASGNASGERADERFSQFGSRSAGRSAYAAVYEETIDSVAQIRVYTPTTSGQGTGFVYDRENHLVTNEHVVENAADVYVRFPDSGWIRADVVGTDVYSDLAVLSVDPLPEPAAPLPFRRSDPAVGTEVIAIGNPFGFSGTATAGIISGVNRTLDAANDFSIPDAIQTDAPVNPGNSGGPLVTLGGNVAGVVNSGGGDNIGFAISASLVRRVVPELIAAGDYDHSYMGVRISPVDPLLAEANALKLGRGVYVNRTVPGGPAEGVLRGTTGQRTVNGIERPTGGDVIVAMGGTAIPTMQALSTFLALETSPGDTIEVEVLRGGSRRRVELTLGARPDP